MKPKKSLGQNFLINKHICSDIVEAGEVCGTDVVLEIGPGKGVLTEKILEKAGKVIAIEKDVELCEFLRQKFAQEISSGKFELISGDVLNFDFPARQDLAGKYKLLANIPYYITGQIIEKFLTAENQPSVMVLMVQKEVANRVVAKDRKESILSMSVKVYGEPKYIKTVKAGNFFPKPSVDSAVLKISNISKDFFQGFSETDFFSLVKAGFAHKRKMLIGNLTTWQTERQVDWKQMFEKCGISEKARAEELSLKDWGSLLKSLN
jgi:16S rRNA (adenine1518-N6/adenine1519-N6)-dimethyltransferase